jgi:hypothetical protein
MFKVTVVSEKNQEWKQHIRRLALLSQYWAISVRLDPGYLAPHTSGPRDVPRCGALSLLQKTLHYRGGSIKNRCYRRYSIQTRAAAWVPTLGY